MPSSTRSIRRRLRARLVLAVVLAAGSAAACVPGGNNVGGGTGANPISVSTKAPTTAVTLKLYDGQGLKGVDDALIKAFESKYPKVKINTTYDPDNVTTQNEPRQLAAASPPDLIRVISVTSGVKNGLLTNLDAYSSAYGWDQLPNSQLSQFRARDGVAGSGALYAKPSGFTMTGLYYNKKLAAQIGMTTPPATVDQLSGLMAKAKQAGLIGMDVSNKQGGGVFPYQLLLNTSMGPQKVAEWVFNAPGATIDNAASLASAEQVVTWNKDGYFPSGINGIDATAADALFAANKAVFYPWGNWDAANLDKVMPGNVGFTPMPSTVAGGGVAAMSDAATAFGIPSRSKHKDAAALFLNFLSSDQARQIAVDNGFMPTGTPYQHAPTIKAGSVLSDVVAAFNKVSAASGQVPFVQNATAAISNQGWNPESQLLLGGRESAAQFVKNVQAKYEAELS